MSIESHDRTDTIPLAADIARCEPADCVSQIRAKCARYQATIPKWGSVSDFSREHPGGTALCSGFIGSAATRVAKSPPRPPKRHWSEP
jgi:hypothetical protein